MKLTSFLTLLACLNISILQSQAHHPHWKNYTYLRIINDIDLDDDGNVWIATNGGLIKYNKRTGESTIHTRASSNLPDNFLLSVHCSNDGAVWTGGKYYGVGKLTKNSCSLFNTANSGLPMNQLNKAIDTDGGGNLWIASFRTIAQYDGKNWNYWETGNPYHAFPIISDLKADKKGTVWVRSLDGLSKIENGKYSETIQDQGITGTIAVDNIGTVWVSTDKGVYMHSNSGTSLLKDSAGSTIKATDLSIDVKNRLWLARGKSLTCFNKQESKTFSQSDTSFSIYKICSDINDTVWCGSWDGHLMCFDGSDFNMINIEHNWLSDGYITSFCFPGQNKVLIGTANGVNIVSQSNVEHFSGSPVASLFTDSQNRTWIANRERKDSCLQIVSDKKTIIFNSDDLPWESDDYNISCFAESKNGDIWLGTHNGVFQYKNSIFTEYSLNNCEIISNAINAIVFDHENVLWVGTDNGLSSFDGKNWKKWDTETSELPTNIIMDVEVDNSNGIWLSCMDKNRITGKNYGGGVVKFDRKNMIQYNINNSGLSSNTVFDILADENGIWFGTSTGGISYFNGDNTWHSFTVENSGIASNDVQILGKEGTGKIWAGHINAGVSVFAPEPVLKPISAISDQNQITYIYPNPAEKELTITKKLVLEEIKLITVLDSSGTPQIRISPTKQTLSSPSFKIDISGLAKKQAYFIIIENDEERVTAKFLTK